MWNCGLYVSSSTCTWVSETVCESTGKGLVLSPLLIILVLETLSHEFRTGVLWELLYADDPAMFAQLTTWKNGMEGRSHGANIKKTKLMILIIVIPVCRDKFG